MSLRIRFKTLIALTTLALAAAGPAVAQSLSGQPPAIQAATATDEAAIRSVLASYNTALNAGRTDAVMPLYMADGIFMAPYAQSAIGRDAVRKAYDAVFAELKFDVRFDVAEVVEMAPTWAFVRTNSVGTTLHQSTGRTTSEANQELFLLQKGEGQWRIARYSFSPTNPPTP